MILRGDFVMKVKQFRYGADNLGYLVYGAESGMAIDGGAADAIHLPRYRFNMAKTKRHVALPGQSEHGSLQHPAIDLINADGINGEDNPKNFRLLPEYRWMTLYAGEYGFELSFPEAAIDSAFEPWHRRYCQ